uniref:Retinitis pigmentosa 9 protein n=1 Tax=Oncorhynchus tshawytscha TaxID=74940 RepID=A0AAZ3R6I0_ONCTS
MSSRKRSRDSEDRGDRKRHKESKHDVEKLKKQARKLNQEVQKLKHLETFYEKPPPGLIKAEEYKPEDCIPADPGNEDARDFLAHAPTKGLWMPLGKEVKVMQCWRCKRYGHRTGDRECPFFIKGNQKLEQFRVDWYWQTPLRTPAPGLNHNTLGTSAPGLNHNPLGTSAPGLNHNPLGTSAPGPNHNPLGTSAPGPNHNPLGTSACLPNWDHEHA